MINGLDNVRMKTARFNDSLHLPSPLIINHQSVLNSHPLPHRGDLQMTTTAMSLTPPLPSSFQLAPDEVHSWCASLDVPPETSARLYATLTPDERSRSARFHFERDRQRFIIARGVLRHLLGRYLQTQPDRIRFVYNAFGKPDVSPEFGNRLKFNLSHSADLALIAIAT